MIMDQMSKIPSIIVPARLASTRFPRKLLHEVRGKPIIVWTAERIRTVAPEFPLYFAVDDDALESCLNSAGFDVVRTCPDHPSGTDRLAEANASVGASAVINVSIPFPGRSSSTSRCSSISSPKCMKRPPDHAPRAD